jgi:hypothetical protein
MNHTQYDGPLTMNKDAYTRTAFLAVLFLGLFAMAARNSTDPDLWWHLATGRFIVLHKAVPHADPFSYTSINKPWIAHEWLSDVLFYRLYHSTGWSGLIVLFAVVITASFFLLYLRCGSNVYVAGVTTLCAALATRPVWGVRPQVLSLLLTSLWLLLLERSEHNHKVLWWTVPFTLLWVNLHAGFALGPVLYGLFLLGHWIENKCISRNRPASCEQSSTRLSIRPALLILVLDFLLVPFNPNGARLFWYPIQTLRSSAMQTYIAEWASPNFHRPEYWTFLLLILATFAMVSLQPASIRLRDLLLLTVSLFAALRSIRLIPLFVLIAIPLISKQVAKWLRARPSNSPPRDRLNFPARQVLNLCLIVGMALFAGLHTARVIRQQPQSEAENFPEAAVAFLQTHAPVGRVFNSYDWGGYLVWRLYPAVRVFIDGRADLYGDQFLHEFADTYGFKDGWRQTLERWNIQTVVVPVDSALATGLRNAPGWSVAFNDSHAIVLTRSPIAIDVSSPFAHPLDASLKGNSTPVHDGYPGYARNYTLDTHLRVIIVANISPASDVRVTGTQIPAGQTPLSAWKSCSKRLISSRRASYGVPAQVVA